MRVSRPNGVLRAAGPSDSGSPGRVRFAIVVAEPPAGLAGHHQGDPGLFGWVYFLLVCPCCVIVCCFRVVQFVCSAVLVAHVRVVRSVCCPVRFVFAFVCVWIAVAYAPGMLALSFVFVIHHRRLEVTMLMVSHWVVFPFVLSFPFLLACASVCTVELFFVSLSLSLSFSLCLFFLQSIGNFSCHVSLLVSFLCLIAVMFACPPVISQRNHNQMVWHVALQLFQTCWSSFWRVSLIGVR